ncbi:MAG: Uncharacterised protein [Flavobacteriia bacterium]|nr:MAG: Uncharacterised protein [Flavobacteriia bacterium]
MDGLLLEVCEPGLLRRDLHGCFQIVRIVGQYLTPDAVFERRNDGTAVGVIFRVGREDELKVQRQPQFETPNLDIALLQDVEQGDLDPGLQVRQLIDHKNAPMGPGHHAKVNGALVGITQAQIGGFQRIDIADQIGHTHIRSGQFFHEPL